MFYVILFLGNIILVFFRTFCIYIFNGSMLASRSCLSNSKCYCFAAIFNYEDPLDCFSRIFHFPSSCIFFPRKTVKFNSGGLSEQVFFHRSCLYYWSNVNAEYATAYMLRVDKNYAIVYCNFYISSTHPISEN